MSGNPYLFAAYVVTWVIHVTYITTIVRRYSRLKREAGVGSQVSGVRKT
jgi:CcmD family protein